MHTHTHIHTRNKIIFLLLARAHKLAQLPVVQSVQESCLTRGFSFQSVDMRSTQGKQAVLVIMLHLQCACMMANRHTWMH